MFINQRGHSAAKNFTIGSNVVPIFLGNVNNDNLYSFFSSIASLFTHQQLNINKSYLKCHLYMSHGI